MITTARMKVTVAKSDGAITDRELGGNQFAQDANRWLAAETVNGHEGVNPGKVYRLVA